MKSCQLLALLLLVLISIPGRSQSKKALKFNIHLTRDNETSALWLGRPGGSFTLMKKRLEHEFLLNEIDYNILTSSSRTNTRFQLGLGYQLNYHFVDLDVIHPYLGVGGLFLFDVYSSRIVSPSTFNYAGQSYELLLCTFPSVRFPVAKRFFIDLNWILPFHMVSFHSQQVDNPSIPPAQRKKSYFENRFPEWDLRLRMSLGVRF